MKKQFIEGSEYNGLLEKTRYGIKKVEDAVDIYEYLKDKKTKIRVIGGDDKLLENPHLEFLERLFGRTKSDRACGFTEADEEFLKSNYLSRELKKEINNRLNNCSKELVELLNSEKQINDFSKEEIKEIIELFKTISNSLSDEAKYDYGKFYYIFDEYLFALDGNGPIEYIKEKYGKDLPIAMLERSNVVSRASYYSGYGVDNSLLGDRHLFSLYKKFVKYYPDKAAEFVKMVMSISKLTPTEFITNYLSFVRNGLDSDFKSKEGNFSVDGLHGSSRDLVGAVSMFSLFSREQSDLDRRFELDEHFSIRKRFTQMIEQFKSIQELEEGKANKISEVKVLDRKLKHDYIWGVFRYVFRYILAMVSSVSRVVSKGKS